MIATFYARVSTDLESQQSSILNQTEFFEDYLKKNNIIKVKDCGVLYRKNGQYEKTEGFYVDEGLTASKSDISNRRAFQQMIKDAKAGKFNIIYTKSISRFSRSMETTVKLIKDLKEYGVGVYFSDFGLNSIEGQNEMLIGMFASHAQEESRIKSVNIHTTMKKLMNEKKWTANPPYGYNKVNGFLILNEYEAPIIKDIFQWYLDGLGIIKIRNLLNEKNIVTKRNKAKWNSRTVASILSNLIFTGKMVQHKTMKDDLNRGTVRIIHKDQHIIHQMENLRIIDDRTYEKVQEEKDNRMKMLGTFEYLTRYRFDLENETEQYKVKKMVRGNQRHSNNHLFSNLFFCGNCKGTMRRKKTYWKKKNKNDQELKYTWMCRNNDIYGKDTCAYRNTISEDELTEIVIRELTEYLNGNHKKMFDDYLFTRFDTKENDTKKISLDNEILKLESEKSGIFRLYNEGTISKEDFKKEYDKVNETIKNMNQELSVVLNFFNEIENAKVRYDEFVFSIESVDIGNLNNLMLKRIILGINITKYDNVVFESKDDPYYFPNPSISIGWRFMDTTEDEILDKHVKKWSKIYDDTRTDEEKAEIRKNRDKLAEEWDSPFEGE
jgi:site-specific DNA recombinase